MKKSKSCNHKIVNNRILIVGIDIAKKLHFARIMFADGRVSKPLSFHNNKEGFTSFYHWLRLHIERGGHDSAVVGLESTGHYWKPLAYFLDKISWISLVQVNPAHVKKAKEIYDSTPGKTDKKDAGVIAMLIQMGRYHNLVLPQGEFALLRVYARHREQKIVELGVQRNILHSLVDTIFPEYGTVFKKLESKTSLYILGRYSTPGRIIKLGLTRLTAAVRRASRGQLSSARAEQLIAVASSSVGLREGTEAIVYAIRKIVAAIKRIQAEIEEVEGRLTTTLKEIPYAEQLLTINGLGPASLAIILGESGDIRRYCRVEELIKLAGLNLYEISSGQHRGRRRISKRGRPLLRKTLYFAALRMVKTSGVFRADYLRLTEKNNMQKTKAQVAITRKLLRVLFALARDNASYINLRNEIALAA